MDRQKVSRVIKWQKELLIYGCFRGFEFIWNHLKMEDVQCYWRSLLKDYTQLLRFKIKPGVTDDLTEIL